MKKVQTQLLVSPHTRTRIRAIAIVRGESSAEISRRAIDCALEDMLARNQRDVNRLFSAAESAGVSLEKLTDFMIEHGIIMDDLFDGSGDPWGSLAITYTVAQTRKRAASAKRGKS